MPNVPPLRFPEFSGEWEKCKNEEIFSVVTEKNKQRLYENVLSASQQYGMVERSSLGIDVKFEEDSIVTYKIVRKGDYVIHLRSFQGGFAFSDNTGVCSPAYTILRPVNKLQYGFLRPYFVSKKFIDTLRIVTYGIRDGRSISVEEWLKLKTSIPHPHEQNKILSFLSLIDKRIETQIRVIDKLESLIKGISKMLLAKQGNTCIKDCLICNSSTLQESTVSESGKYPAWGATGISGYIKTPQVEQDAILIIKDGASVGNVRYVSGRYGVIGTLNYLTAKSGYNLKYLYFCLRIFNFTPFITGLAIPHIYFRDYGNAQIYCPNISDQKQIAEELSNIEGKIEIEKQILDKLKEQKNYLLSQMFI